MFNKLIISIVVSRFAALLLIVGVFTSPVYAGSWQQNVSIGGFNSVHIYTPDSNSPIGSGKSLLLVLHGCVQPIGNYLTANLESAAETHGMVIAVPDAMNKAGFSCWSYWQGAINRNSADYANVIGLANALSGDTSRSIDVNQVYIAGLSSGAAFAAQAACVAPDIFAGVAPSAGPTIGTSSNGAIGTCEIVSATTFKSRCESYAGTSFKHHFSTQIAAVAHGDADTTVDTCYNQQNANGYAHLYDVTQLSGSSTINEGAGHTANLIRWSDDRVSMLWLNGLDHSWSGGAGASGSYVAGDSINFATYLGGFFAQNNLRVDRNQGPQISNHAAVETGDKLRITGIALDAEGYVSEISLTINELESSGPVLVDTITATVNPSDGAYLEDSAVLADGLYEVTAIATDDAGVASEPVSVQVRIGPEPAAQAPTLSEIGVTQQGQCATVTGLVFDVNQNLQTVQVDFANEIVTASMTGNQYQSEACNLPGGNNTATVTATDATNLSATDSISFVVDAGVTGDYNLHIAQGHISWGLGYSSCYLAFGSGVFTMREVSASQGQCQWVADNAPSCAGPIQSCGNSGGNDADNDGVDDASDNCPSVANSDQADNDNDGIGNVCDTTPNGEGTDCVDYNSSNYTHVVAGRATSTGFYTYAVGSGDYLGLYNIFAYSTLVEVSPGYYEQGSCP